LKRKLCIVLLAGAAVVAALLVSHAPSAQAQPVATITLPAPGAAKQLYPGCNNITLSFPDGTPSQTAVQAVTPPGSVEAMWRHSAALNKFEGFSPAYPQASDLLTVNFLDAVWVCMVEGLPAVAAPPGQVLPPAPLPLPPQPPGADLAVVDLYADNLPQGQVWATIANNGPDSVVNAAVDLNCDATQTPKFCVVPGPCLPIALLSVNQIVLSLDPGQTADFNAGITVDALSFDYTVTCTVSTAVPDPDGGNNSRSEDITYTPPPAAVSDRSLKEGFAFVDGQEVLSRLSDVPITTWSYKAEDPDVRHMGPTAQDFRAAFGLGESDTSINLLDSSGVALAAVQELYQLSQGQAARMQELERTNATLQRQLDGLEAQGEGKGALTGLLTSDLPLAWLLLGGLVVGGLALAGRRLKRARR
jgi:hypothetical protein